MFHIEMYKLMKYIPGKQMEREVFYDQFEKRGKMSASGGFDIGKSPISQKNRFPRIFFPLLLFT